MKLVLLAPSLKFNHTLRSSFRSDVVQGIASIDSRSFDTTPFVDTPFTHVSCMFHTPTNLKVPMFEQTYTKYQYICDGLVDLLTTCSAMLKQKSPQDTLVFDLLSCELNTPPFVQEMNQIEQDLGINVRYSLNQTGTTPDSDWIMESDSVDVKDTYFTSRIENVSIVLSTIVIEPVMMAPEPEPAVILPVIINVPPPSTNDHFDTGGFQNVPQPEAPVTEAPTPIALLKTPDELKRDELTAFGYSADEVSVINNTVISSDNAFINIDFIPATISTTKTITETRRAKHVGIGLIFDKNTSISSFKTNPQQLGMTRFSKSTIKVFKKGSTININTDVEDDTGVYANLMDSGDSVDFDMGSSTVTFTKNAAGGYDVSGQSGSYEDGEELVIGQTLFYFGGVGTDGQTELGGSIGDPYIQCFN